MTPARELVERHEMVPSLDYSRVRLDIYADGKAEVWISGECFTPAQLDDVRDFVRKCLADPEGS